MDEMGPIIMEFISESYENLDRLDQDLVELEANPEERSLLANIFRTIHTIKGTCGFLGFTKLEGIAHVGENLLSQLRDGTMDMTPQIADALLSMVDAVRQILSCIENDRNEGDVDYTQLVELLTRLNEGKVSEVPAETPASAPAPETPPVAVENSQAAGAGPAGDSENSAALSVEAAPPAPPEPGAQAGAGEESRQQVVRGEDRRQGDRRQGVDSNIRVDVHLLDRLMNLVGELVLARNQILQYAQTDRDPTFATTTQHLNQLTSELQEGVMKTRMQPIGNIWSKYPRVVRDLAHGCGKQVRLEMEGKETELDKTLIEAIKDPLTHMVRNSVDHGIETPDIRKARGKPEEGRLLLRAYHEGGQVNIEIIDDGGGIDSQKLKEKAIAKNIISAERANRMSERELTNLIFAPGFSTAEQVSNISGRGVGMDVVKTNIEKIGGKIDITSEIGKGTTFKMKIPLTLAIVPALIVTCNGNRYCIPQVSLLELVRLDPERAEQEIERIQGQPVYRLRGNLLPLVYLSKELGISSNGTGDKSVNIVVLQADNRQFGLLVEKILDTEEIVVKPLGTQLKGITAYSGATIMGDGKVALILDVMGLAQKAHVIGEEGRERAEELLRTAADLRREEGEKQTLLIFSAGDNSRMAVPLSMVARLEEFKWNEVECSGGQDVVQYRGEIMPLIHLSQVLNGKPTPRSENGMMQAIVYSERGRSVGVVVDKILDIVEETVNLKTGTGRKGILGSAVVQKKVTDLLDVEAIILEADPGFYNHSEPALVAPGSNGSH